MKKILIGLLVMSINSSFASWTSLDGLTVEDHSSQILEIEASEGESISSSNINKKFNAINHLMGNLVGILSWVNDTPGTGDHLVRSSVNVNMTWQDLPFVQIGNGATLTSFNNIEWIDNSKVKIRIKDAKKGIYKITVSARITYASANSSSAILKFVNSTNGEESTYESLYRHDAGGILGHIGVGSKTFILSNTMEGNIDLQMQARSGYAGTKGTLYIDTYDDHKFEVHVEFLPIAKALP